MSVDKCKDECKGIRVRVGVGVRVRVRVRVRIRIMKTRQAKPSQAKPR